MRIVESDGMGNNGAGKLMRIGALARKAGTTMRTIRYYEERGLLSPRGRTKGGFRLRSCAQCVRVPGPESCESCPVIGSVERLPLHMQAIVETA
jgi:hypothetical protein